MNAYRAKPNNIPWPPIIALSAVLFSVLAGFVIMLPFPQGPILRSVGVLMLLSVVAIDIWSISTLRAAHTTFMPTKGSSHLVTKGPFGYSRNPIYVGNVLLLLALGLILANAWFILFAVVTAVAIQKFAVEREEQHLLAVFGAEYESYCLRVRRWL
ncbi:MAG: isoprenylcysteine carboxylmethyltransferase family protein [Hyphomicrobiales bacterium]|nr:isoprenylcysteine carboxylmethyltransferase family protein [Hyphomicrobiales bacterium]MCP4998970.1 isoprenylcysteine carboxylmethyltransferase family protein [Hyphomicrobiales bacterium]